MWTVFLLYDYPLFARGLERLLEQEGGVKIAGIAARGEKGLVQIRALKPDVIIVEAQKGMPEPCWLLTRLLQEQPEARGGPGQPRGQHRRPLHRPPLDGE